MGRRNNEVSEKSNHNKIDTPLSINGTLMSLYNQSGSQLHTSDHSDSSSLISAIGRDNSISCLVQSSRADYGAIASLNRSFRSLVRTGELYKLRRKKGVVEHWVYFSCQLVEWEAFDPKRQHWMELPKLNTSACFLYGYKDSLAVGTELLLFGRELMSNAIYRYSLLTNSWSTGLAMNAPRWLFGSASLGEIAILAGGCDLNGEILDSAELYNSEEGTWETLPNMNKSRKMCSGVFMDGKFYIVGGIGGADSKLLTCGEEYNLETRTWTVIPNMSPVCSGDDSNNETRSRSEAPPLIAVVNNQLYAADHVKMNIRKYDKSKSSWNTIGRLPERVDSMNGWGSAIMACGDRLIMIGGPRSAEEGLMEIYAWVPGEGPPQWGLLARKEQAVVFCIILLLWDAENLPPISGTICRILLSKWDL